MPINEFVQKWSKVKIHQFPNMNIRNSRTKKSFVKKCKVQTSKKLQKVSIQTIGVIHHGFVFRTTIVCSLCEFCSKIVSITQYAQILFIASYTHPIIISLVQYKNGNKHHQNSNCAEILSMFLWFL